MEIKVELDFNADAGAGPFFQVGDSLRGVIGGPFVLAGESVFVDISDQLVSMSINRGKSRELNRFEAGQVNLSFNNNSRDFDPTFEPSPFFGQIVPRRRIRVSIDGDLQFVGVVEDWSLAYDPSGLSIATAVAVDSFATLSGQFIDDFTPDEELSGARVNAVLDNVGWPAELRDIDTGEQLLESQIITTPTAVLEYLGTVESSEPGAIFMSKSGNVKFVGRFGGFVETETRFSDSGDGIPYETVSVIYGSELLYNKIVLRNTLDEYIADDLDSQATYGVSELIQDTFIENLADLEETAEYLLGNYKEPEFRFENLSVNLSGLTTEQQAEALALELGDIVQIKFEPSNIPPQIVQAARIISIQHRASPERHDMVFGFESLANAPFIIGSANFAIIGEGTIGF